MRFNQIVETTTAGSVATVAQLMMTQTRENINVPGLKPVQQLMKGKSKKKGPYANSINEGKVKQLTIDLTELTDEEFKKKYGKTKVEIRSDMKKVNEDDLAEQDLIVIPGQGRLRRTGFVKQDLDQGEHEGHTLKNSLHTIARAASDLDKRLSVQSEFPEWVSEKIGAAKGMMVTVMDYLISSQEMQHDTDSMAEDMSNTDYTPQVGEEILWRSRNPMNKMMPVPGTVLAIAPGKVTIKIKSPRLIQNIGKDTIVLNLSDYVLMPKQGVSEASNTMQRYGQLIIKRAREARAAEAREKAEQEKAEQEKAEKEKAEKEMKKSVAEDSVLDLARQRVQAQGFTDSPEERNADRLERKRRHQAGLDRLSNLGGFGSEEEAKHQAQQRMARDAYSTQRMKDSDEDWGHTFDMMRDRLNRMQWSSQRNVDPEQIAALSNIRYEPRKKASESTVDEAMGGGVDAKGRTAQEWVKLVKAKYPDAKILQSKIPNGPWAAKLSDGRTTYWEPAEQGVAEGNRPFRGVGGAFNRGDDERHDLDPTDWYIVKDGEMFSASIYPRQVQQAISQGFSRTRAEAKSRANSQGVAEDDSALQAFLSKGGTVQQLSYKKPRKADKTDYGSRHIGGSGDKMKASRTGTAARTQGNKVAGIGEAFDLDDLRKAAASSRSPEDNAALKRNPNFGKLMQKSVNKHNKAVVKTRQDIGSRIADIGAGGKEYNVKTDAAWDAAKKKVSEGSKQ